MSHVGESDVAACNRCHQAKSLSEYGSTVKRGRPYRKKICRACDRASGAAKRADPKYKAILAARQKERFKDPAVKARAAATHRKYYAEHQDAYQKRAYTRANEYWSERLIYSARTASRQRIARGRDCPMMLTKAHLEDLWVKQGGICHFTGLEMTKERHRLDTVSIDRVDPSKGYEPGNVVLATKAANFAKTGHSESEFREFLDRVADSVVASRRIKSVA